MTPLAEIRWTTSELAVVAAMSGELDSSNADAIAEQAVAGCAPDAAGLVVDLTEVRFIDSAGIRALFTLGQRITRRRQGICIVLPDDAVVWRVLQIARVGDAIPIRASLEAAEAVLREAI